jgi:hypothetical protein
MLYGHLMTELVVRSVDLLTTKLNVNRNYSRGTCYVPEIEDIIWVILVPMDLNCNSLDLHCSGFISCQRKTCKITKVHTGYCWQKFEFNQRILPLDQSAIFVSDTVSKQVQCEFHDSQSRNSALVAEPTVLNSVFVFRFKKKKSSCYF